MNCQKLFPCSLLTHQHNQLTIFSQAPAILPVCDTITDTDAAQLNARNVASVCTLIIAVALQFVVSFLY